MFISYVGIRVTDLDRSIRFYQEIFGLKLVRRGDFSDKGGGKFALLRDLTSGQRLELNWYADGSRYAVEYEPGEGLDHIGVKVESVAEMQKMLAEKGIEIIPIPGTISTQHFASDFTMHIGFVKDPDGNWIGLYDHDRPVQPFDPDNY